MTGRSAGMHASAHPTGVPLMEYSGTLLHAAEARSRVLDGNYTSQPVLCMDIELDNAMRTRMRVEQPFPLDQHARAMAEAKRLHKGMHVTVQAPLVDMQLVARNVCSIAVAPCAAPASPSQPQPFQPPIDDLFQEQS